MNIIKLRLVNIKAQGKDIILFVRDKSGKKYIITVKGFQPYFYSKTILLDEHVTKVEKGYKTLYGENVYKIYVDHPRNVPKLRKSDDYEADIPYVIRFLIDTGIKDYIYIKQLKNTIDVSDIMVEDHENTK